MRNNIPHIKILEGYIPSIHPSLTPMRPVEKIVFEKSRKSADALALADLAVDLQ